MKTCKDCKQLMPAAAFAKGSPRSADGLYPYCRTCAALRKKAYRQANPEKDRLYAAKVAETKRNQRIATEAAELLEMARSGKVCHRCQTKRPLFDFGAKAKAKFGIDHWCRSCNANERRAYYQKHAEHLHRQRLRARAYATTPAAQDHKKKARHRLDDTYVREQLVKRSNTLRETELPQGLIDAKREQLRILRELRKEDHEER